MSEQTATRSREEAAKIEIGQTGISDAMAYTLIIGFLAVIITVPVAQYLMERPSWRALEIANGAHGLRITRFLTSSGSLLNRLHAGNRELLSFMQSIRIGSGGAIRF